jgi:hypothetical protein
VGSATIALATACGGSDSTAPAAAPEFLVVRFPDGYRAASTMIAGVEQRMPFAVADSVDIMREGAPDRLTFLITQGETVITETAVDAHREGIITPYYPVKATFPEAGAYAVSLADYPDIPPADILVADASEVSLLQPGDSLPAVGTPTIDDSRGVVDICTRAIDCPFHDHNLDDVLTNGRPTVLLIATPGFCQTDICGPVVDLLIEESPSYEGIDFIHAEVYVDPADFEGGGFPDTSPIVSALGLPYEPILFAANGAGELVTRLDLAWDRAELNEAIATL